MVVQTQLCFLLFGTCLFSFLLLLECRKLEGYDFPVFSTIKCPGNQAEWKKRSSAINCTKQNGYMCLPNENLTDLLEFCYIYPRILVQKDLCLYLDKRFSKVDSYNCRRFKHGCPELHYFSSDTYLHQSCMEIENGCFSAEPSCKRQSFRSEHSFDSTTLAINLGVSIPICLLCILALSVIGIRFGICKRRSETVRNDEETELLLCGYEQREPMDNNKEYSIEEVIFDQWKQDDIDFISTKACEKVKKMIKSRNLVIVAGHPGSGKSAIIQHIALKYREHGWTVKLVTKIEDIVDKYCSSRFQRQSTIFVFNDPLGKTSFDEILNDSWQTYEEDLKLCLKTAKLLMSCRNYIMSDKRVTRYLVNQAAIVDIDEEKYKLSVDEKRQILTNYASNMNLSEKDCNEIVQVETYFPLLCKLYSIIEEFKNKGTSFFTEPVKVLKEEITRFRKKDKGKYCAVALLVLFNDDLCVSDLSKYKDTGNKFKHILKLCRLPENTSPLAIRNTLDSLKGFFVKTTGDKYHFYHDFLMEVTTHVFGTDHPGEIIKYGDIGLLRQRVRLGDCEEDIDPYTICLSDNNIETLGERLFTDMFGNCLTDVVLNPCLKNKKVIEALKKKIQMNPEILTVLLEKKEIRLKMQKYNHTEKVPQISKLAFVGFENDITPLFVLIVLGHTGFVLECLNTLQQTLGNFVSCSLLSAVYCNGSLELFHIFSKDHVKNSMLNNWGELFPIHIASVFHNYEILQKLIQTNVKINFESRTFHDWTPLLLAAGNDTLEYGDYNRRESGAERRDKTVQLLLENGADINLCAGNGTSPLFVACQNGHDSTVQLLLNKGANVHLCMKNGASPLYIACQEGHESIVQLLLSNRANINLCDKDGTSPLYIACENGHDNTVKLLVSNGADVNLCMKNAASPLYIACENGHDNTVKLLLSNGADVNLCMKNGASPLYIACQEGHDSTVELLLSKGANIDLCDKDGTSPLYTACQEGHDSTVELLLSNGADTNLSVEDGTSPLYIACQEGHDSTVQLLLRNGANINLSDEDGSSPLSIACQNGHDNTVHLLLSNGADTNLSDEDGTSPLYIACQNGYDSIVQLLLSNGANINLCDKDGTSPLYIACQHGNDSTVQLLLSNGANINLSDEDGFSPLYRACENRHESTVQLLLSNDADINLSDEYGSCPLFVACENGHDSLVQLLLSNGANISLCTKKGVSPLYIACVNGHENIVHLLVSKGADINLPDEDGFSPLHTACYNGHDSTVQLLLSNGANVNLCMKNGASPLYIACQEGHDSTVQLLLSKGANIDLCDKNGTSPLYTACQEGHDSTVELLLSNGADTNLSDEDGTSPLYIACQEGHDSTVQLLLRNGANIDLCDKDGTSPLYIACQEGHDSTVQLLLSNGANINLYIKGEVSPLYIAFVHRRYETINVLLNNGVDTSLACGWKVNPDLKDCFDKHYSVVEYLLQKDNIQNNMHDPDSFFSLFVTCQVERETRSIFARGE